MYNKIYTLMSRESTYTYFFKSSVTLITFFLTANFAIIQFLYEKVISIHKSIFELEELHSKKASTEINKEIKPASVVEKIKLTSATIETRLKNIPCQNFALSSTCQIVKHEYNLFSSSINAAKEFQFALTVFIIFSTFMTIASFLTNITNKESSE